jgi:hypothetical protein
MFLFIETLSAEIVKGPHLPGPCENHEEHEKHEGEKKEINASFRSMFDDNQLVNALFRRKRLPTALEITRIISFAFSPSPSPFPFPSSSFVFFVSFVVLYKVYRVELRRTSLSSILATWTRKNPGTRTSSCSRCR